ncbi:MAG: M1 family metallopeptidase [Balneolaceae bacterium]
MKRLLPAIAFIFTFLISCGTPQPVTETESFNSTQQVTETERLIPYPPDLPDAFLNAMDNGTRSETGEPGPDYWQNEAIYILDAELFPDDHRVRGTATISYFNHSPDVLDRIVIELAQNLHKAGTPKKEITEITGGVNLHSIEVNGRELDEINMFQRFAQNRSGYMVEGTQLYLFPDLPVRPGSAADLKIEWSFEVPEKGASGRMGRNRGNLYFIAYWYPKIAVYDDVYGWFDDDFLGNAEFYHGFAEYQLSVTAPEGWIVMGTGEFLNPDETLSERTLERYNLAAESDEPVMIVNEDEFETATREGTNGRLTWRFSSEKVRDVAFSATRESIWESARTSVGDLNGDGEENYTRIHSFYRKFAPLWREQLGYAQHSITFLSDFTGLPYPWPHMTSVEGAGIIGGGMEFPMMTIMGSYNGRMPRDLYSVTAHELAHMWFPMIVSTNERRYTWIDEGYTSFHTHQAETDFYPGQYDNFNMYGSYLQIAGSDFEGPMMRWSDYHYPGPAYGIASYPKPASVLTALQNMLGDELFMETLHELIERWKYKHPYPWDIFNTIEDVTGMDLSWFWRSWFYETWTLDHSIADVIVDNSQTKIIVEDLGDVVMPVFVQITLENGNILTEKIEADHWLRGNRTAEIVLETSSPVTEVALNPDLMYPETNFNNNIWEAGF